MMSARKRAIEIVWEVQGKSISADAIVYLMSDDSDSGRAVKSLVACIEKGIERDREQRLTLIRGGAGEVRSGDER